jgi:hypothetical protein
MLKIVLPFLGGGLGGAILNEWYRRKHGKLQKIPLIERVNRVVSPKLHGGITLARATGEGPDRQLTELRNLREYQLTLRNTSTVHLQDVEIQFDFPTVDVQEYASPRTTLSRTSLVKVFVPNNHASSETIFRWQIPHFPSGDSVEFTFQAVNPETTDYEVALYKSERVIVEKAVGEPDITKKSANWGTAFGIGFIGLLLALLLIVAQQLTIANSIDKLAVVKEGGCDLRIFSTYDRISQGSSIRTIQTRVYNEGHSDCIVAFELFDPKGPLTIAAGETVTRERLSQSRPKLTSAELSVGPTASTLKKTSALIYVETFE